MRKKILMRESDKVKREVQLLDALCDNITTDIFSLECGITSFADFVEMTEEHFRAFGERLIELKGVAIREETEEVLKAARMSTPGPSIN